MTVRVGSDAAAPTARPFDEPGEIEARFEQNDTLSHRTVGALSWMFVNASGQILAARGWGAWALVDGQVSQAVIHAALLCIVVPHPRRPCLARESVQDLVSYGGGKFLGRIGTWIAMQGDNFVVGRTLGADALGLYGASSSQC